ncbi:hypothetical protein CR513_34325, partial [Mucuna pruriens]
MEPSPLGTSACICSCLTRARIFRQSLGRILGDALQMPSIDATYGGRIKKKSPSEAYAIIEKMTSNTNHFSSSDRHVRQRPTEMRCNGEEVGRLHQIDRVTDVDCAISSSHLTTSHDGKDYWINNFFTEVIEEVNFIARNQNNSYSDHYNAGLDLHPSHPYDPIGSRLITTTTPNRANPKGKDNALANCTPMDGGHASIQGDLSLPPHGAHCDQVSLLLCGPLGFEEGICLFNMYSTLNKGFKGRFIKVKAAVSRSPFISGVRARSTAGPRMTCRLETGRPRGVHGGDDRLPNLHLGDDSLRSCKRRSTLAQSMLVAKDEELTKEKEKVVSLVESNLSMEVRASLA